MYSLGYKRSTYVCFYVAVLVFVCGLAIPIHTIWTYIVDQHKWFYSHNLLDLSARDETYFNTRRWDYDGWTPGSPKWLVDLTELHSKLPRNTSMNGHHKILYYNKRTVLRLTAENSLLKMCPYTNCHLTDRWEEFAESSAVIFEISHHPMELPTRARPDGQIWIFHDFEPPVINGHWDHRHRSWIGKMNWSMSFRYDSDIIRNYGYLKTRQPDKIPKIDYHEVFTGKKKFAAWIVSNCGSMGMSARNEYVNELRKYIPIDVYGKCGTKVVNRTYDAIKSTLKDYKFYLSFENSFCTDYVTEKFFNYFQITDAVLVVRGGADYDTLLPQYTHINAQNFLNAKDLATYLLTLNSSEEEYTKYLKTRDKYEIHHMNWVCNLCIKLNNKDSYAKVYDSLVEWWHTDKCWAATDIIITWTAKRQWAVILMLFTLCLTTVYVYTMKPFSRSSTFLPFMEKA